MSDVRRDSLFEIPFENFAILKDKYKVDWPNHIIAYSLLDNFVRRFEKNPANCESLKVYSLNGEWQSDGTFIAVMGRHVVFATLDPSHKNLKTALKLLSYTGEKLLCFFCVRSKYLSVIDEIIHEADLQVMFRDCTKMKYIEKEVAAKFTIEPPLNFKLRSLKLEDAVKINSVWPMRSEDSVHFIEYMIENNINVGLYDEFDELTAWCLQLDFGSLATLQVDENHLKKGYGSLVAKFVSKQIALENDVDVTANVVLDNFKSMNLFQKLGFKDIDENYWIGVRKDA